MIFELPLRLFRFVFSIQSKRELRETALHLNIQITEVRRANSALIRDNERLVEEIEHLRRVYEKRTKILKSVEELDNEIREAFSLIPKQKIWHAEFTAASDPATDNESQIDEIQSPTGE